MNRIFTMMTLVLSVFWTFSVMAQNRTVSGKITSSDGIELPGVNVIEENTTNGVVTDVDGNYTITLSGPNAVLLFSFIGYQSETIPVGGQTQINVSLKDDVKELSEVVVTALGIERSKSSLGYAVQEVDGDQLTESKDDNIVNSLSGKIAGVQVMGATGNIGGSSRILIRGANTIASNNQPLFIIDGMPVDNSNYGSYTQAYGGGDAALSSNKDYGNAAQDINPEDIESISVLKGPNASALYGSRGANGVILITTKKGSKKPGLGVSFSTGLTLSQSYVFPDFQNKYGGGQSQDFLGDPGQPEQDVTTDESWGPALNGQQVLQWGGPENEGEVRPWVAHPDNYKDFFEIGTRWENHIAVSGQDEKNTYRMSFTRLDEKGTIPKSELTRNTINLSIDKQLHPKFSAGIDFNYFNTQGRGRPSTGGNSDNFVYNMVIWTQRQIDIERLEEYKYPDGSQRVWRTGGFGDTSPRANNPYWLVNEDYQTDERNRVLGNIKFDYEIVKGLNLRGRLGQDWYADRRADRKAVGTRYTPYYLNDQIEFKEVNADLILAYDKRFANDFSLVATAGGQFYNIKRKRNTQQTSGGLATAGIYSIENSIDRPLIRDTRSEKEVQGVFVTASLGYRDFLYVDVAARNDWSSTLPLDNNSYFYPSVGASFVFSEIVDVPALSFGKIRLGWAKAGNDTDPYQLYQVFGPGTAVGSNPVFSNSLVQKNANLKPEITTSMEIGLDLNFLQDRINLSATYYRNTTRDQIFDINVSNTTGSSTKFVNAGEVENKGIELSLGGGVLRNADGFSWDIMANFSANQNKILELLTGVDSYVMATFYTSGSTIVSLESQVGESFSTIYATRIARMDDGTAIINSDGSYAVTEEPQRIGSVLPDYNLGISNNFTYKNLYLNVLFDIQKGGAIFTRDFQDALYTGTMAETAVGSVREDGIILDGVQLDENNVATENETVLDAQNYFRLMRKTPGDHTVFDASYVKLREVALGYNFPSSIINRTPFNSIRLSLVGRNLAILHRNTPAMIDPESAGNASGNLQGRSYGQLPSIRNFGFKLTTTF